MFHADLSSTNTDSGATYMQPQVPHMLAVLGSFIRTQNVQAEVQDDTFTPNDAQNPALANNHRAFNFNWDTTAAGNAAHQMQKTIFAASGVSSPFRFGNANYPQAQQFARRSDFARHIGIVANDPAHNGNYGAATIETANISTLDQFLFMNKEQNLKWFGFLREQAIIHARFFNKVYHFSDVQSVGGLETTFVCKLKRDGNTRYYPSNNLGLTGVTHNPSWYPTPFADLNGGFATNRSGLRRNEELQAYTHGINATLPIRTQQAAGPPIVYHPQLGTLTEQDGALWSNREMIRELFWADEDVGKPMYNNLNSVVLRCYREKPHGTGVVDNDNE